MNVKNGKNLAVLLIEQDDETRPLLKENLHALGYLIIDALDEIGAVERVLGSQIRPNLILINQVGQPVQSSVSLGQRVRRDSALPDYTPVIVYADVLESDLQGSDIQVGDYEYVTYPEDGEQLFSLIKRLIRAADGT